MGEHLRCMPNNELAPQRVPVQVPLRYSYLQRQCSLQRGIFSPLASVSWQESHSNGETLAVRHLHANAVDWSGPVQVGKLEATRRGIPTIGRYGDVTGVISPQKKEWRSRSFRRSPLPTSNECISTPHPRWRLTATVTVSFSVLQTPS